MHQNWAGNLTYSAREIVRPTSLEQLADVVTAADHVRALGSRHSFNDVADTPGVHVQVDVLDDGRPAVDLLDQDGAENGIVSVNAGLRYGEVSRGLHATGRALGNMASLPHISVAGAVATATHGSGDANQSLSGAVVGLEIMSPGGELRRITRAEHPDVFAGTVVSLGALGVVTRVELTTVPTFSVRQDVAQELPWDDYLDNFDAIMSAAYSVSAFTRWDDPAVRDIWFKSKAGSDGGRVPEVPGARWATTPVHPLPGVDPSACTEQLGVAGPWHERLSHFRLEFTPSAGDEVQSEYLLPRRNVVAAVEAMRRLGPKVAPLLATSEIRTVAGDDLWLSPFDEPSVGFHFTWLPREADVRAVLPDVEAALLPLGARPHWGKVSTVDPRDMAALYPRFGDFRALADRFDPEGRLRGGFVGRLLAG
ncbi:FAD-binding protein [Isoptericola cucumis]|uniref:Xylitol oxidase n=1 Tax=Isoptericola cucumis TaxID=1776856 RepID=A0ABQ2B6R8_9MICO|nr:FAD-binding protein [Isoptericola cucumis]GGI09354.1 xylitol oxidase [Isoptericola cucumis]